MIIFRRSGPEWDRLRIGMDAAEGMVGGKRLLTPEEKQDEWISLGYHIESVQQIANRNAMNEGVLFLLMLLTIVFVFMAGLGYTFYDFMHFVSLIAFGVISARLLLVANGDMQVIGKFNEDFKRHWGEDAWSSISTIIKESDFEKQVLSRPSRRYWVERRHDKRAVFALILRWIVFVIIPFAFGGSILIGAFITGESYWFNALGKLIYYNP